MSLYGVLVFSPVIAPPRMVLLIAMIASGLYFITRSMTFSTAHVSKRCALALFSPTFLALLHDNKPIPDTIVPDTGLLQISFPDVMLPGGATEAKEALCCGF